MACSFPFLNTGAFMKLSKDVALPFAIAGIPYDCATTNRPGARLGPSAIRAASHMLCDGIHPLWDVTLTGSVSDAGDLEFPHTSIEAMREHVKPQILQMLQSQHMLWLGGDHSITLPVLRGISHKWGANKVACIHFDAHCDTWSDHFGEKSGHGTWVYEAVEEGLVDPRCFFQFGIRSSGEKVAQEYVKAHGGVTFTAREMRGLVSPLQLQPMIDAVCSRLQQHGSPPVYISFDIDCLDPAFAPGTGTPEPGGLCSGQVLTLLEEFAIRLPCIGMDVVEVLPAYDHSEITSAAAATFAWTYLCARIHARKNRQQ